jgi:hypothetical protein
MSAHFIQSRTQRKPHVISNGMKSAVSTIYQTACGQIVRWRSDFTDVRYFEPGQVKREDVCGVCLSKTTQDIAA